MEEWSSNFVHPPTEIQSEFFLAQVTAISESNGTIAIFVSKMAYFKGAWRKVKVLPRP